MEKKFQEEVECPDLPLKFQNHDLEHVETDQQIYQILSLLKGGGEESPESVILDGRVQCSR